MAGIRQAISSCWASSVIHDVAKQTCFLNYIYKVAICKVDGQVRILYKSVFRVSDGNYYFHVQHSQFSNVSSVVRGMINMKDQALKVYLCLIWSDNMSTLREAHMVTLETGLCFSIPDTSQWHQS